MNKENATRSTKEASKVQRTYLNADRKLGQTIKHYQSQEKFDTLVKIGEANSILKELDDQSCFQVRQVQGNKFIIRHVIDQQTSQQLTQKDFERVYKQVQRRLNLFKNKNFWNVDIRKEKERKSNFKGTILLVLQEEDEISKEKISQRIKQRDRELKSILLETAHLKMILKEQYQLLQRKGVNSK